ncbi:hypothetical protein GCM10010885_12500 [Alicyclobacillus cellulosilyticus]|uniref:Putative restriction endonuclease domain-containing protein n=2 Tax=Alicyclobacillus cellulosilyticus TaxID=1003997 RepID=A0A917NJ67_9BACL|nr:hypothetical protein GCM10010885_12500 [Alicyclobacillus cellulosilyticus]
MDLTFEDDERTQTVVQPDLFVMCGVYRRERRIIGVPVLVVEVLSPSTATVDTIRKLHLYERVGVKEYWIADPDLKVLFVYQHDGQRLRFVGEVGTGTALRSAALPDLEIDVRHVFA